jgi:integrase
MAVDNKPRTIADKNRLWKRRIKPAIGSLKVHQVTEEDAGAVVRAPLRLDAEGRVVGGRAEAGNVYRLLHHMFRKALLWGFRPRDKGNPLENVAEPKASRRTRLLTAGEVGGLLKALERAEADRTEEPQVIAAIRAVILTGARISELLTLQWDHIRPDETELHLPDTKTGFSRRPISTETLAILQGIERLPGSPFVFRSIKSPSKPLSYSTAEKAFRRIVEAAGVRRYTLHTIRHWFATATANSVSNPRVGMALTGHKSHAAYLNYVHGDKEQARALADQLAALAKGLERICVALNQEC